MRFITLFLIGFLAFAADITAISINEVDYSENEFFDRYPKDEWDAVENDRKYDMIQDFVKHTTGQLAAEELNLPYFPKNRVKLRDQFYRLLVNESYDEFVARNAVSDELREFTREHLPREVLVSHILIGFEGCNLRQPVDRSRAEADLLTAKILTEFAGGKSFVDLAMTYSDDPSVVKNSGKLGWLPVGKTIPAFQTAAFTTPVGSISEPVETEYGIHILLIEQERASRYADMEGDEYEDAVSAAAMGAVYGKLRELAEQYDEAMLQKAGLVYYEEGLQRLVDAIQEKIEKNKIVGSSRINLVSTLNEIPEPILVCVFNGDGYGAKWFASRLDRTPSSRHPQLGSVEEAKTALRTVILQELGYQAAIGANLQQNRSFLAKFDEFENSVLFDAYLKYIVNNIPEPAEDDIMDYYDENKDEKFMEGEKAVVREIKVRDQNTITNIYDKLLEGAEFIRLASDHSLTNPDEGGAIEPFAAGRYGPMGQAAFLLVPGKYSEPVENLDGTWSIVLLEEFIPPQYTPIDKVTNRIVSILKREQQSKAKEETFIGLEEKYNVQINPDFFTKEG